MAVPADPKLRALLEQFVCVRSVQMWGLDLDTFQFDGFLTWAIFFLNADGTIYGRYGSRSESGHNAAADKLISVEGFSKTLQEAINLHEEYTRNPKALRLKLAGKTGPKRVWKFAQDIPEMETMFRVKARFPDRGNRTCIHCHMVPRTEVASLHDLKRPIPAREFWPYPLPRDIGMEMDPEEVATILTVQKGSIADKARLRIGDRIKHINGQPILSTADIQWILHHAGDPGLLDLDIERKSRSKSVKVRLHKGWRLRMKDWRYLVPLMQGYLVNFRGQEADPETRKRLGLNDDHLAFKVSWVNQWTRRPTSPLRDGDIIIAIDGNRRWVSMGTFTSFLFRKPSGHMVRLAVIRSGKIENLVIRIP